MKDRKRIEEKEIDRKRDKDREDERKRGGDKENRRKRKREREKWMILKFTTSIDFICLNLIEETIFYIITSQNYKKSRKFTIFK